jgi:hypothetical protein
LASGGASVTQLGQASKKLSELGINTFVIGFGNGISKPAQLDAIAANGGTGVDKYFQASDQQALEKQLTDIVFKLVSCTYEIGDLEGNNEDREKANFFFDKKTVGRDDNCEKNKGWTWTDDTHSKVTFCESACKRIKNGKVSTVSAQFGCPSVQVI